MVNWRLLLLHLSILSSYHILFSFGKPFSDIGRLIELQRKKFGITPIMMCNAAPNESLAFIFIRITARIQTDSNGASEINSDDELLLVQVAPHTIPTFTRKDYDNLVNMKGSSLSTPLKRLFSFPLPENDREDDDNSAGQIKSEGRIFDEKSESDTMMASVFESTLFIDDGEIFINDPSYKIMAMKELFQLIEARSNTIQSSLANHILHLYRQHKFDQRIPGRRLLHGTSGSNIDEYTLRPKPEVVFFDCDDCLYFDNWKIAGHLTDKIEDHCQKEFGLQKGYAYTLYKRHGTALRGLIAEGHLSKDCSASMDGFLDKVHDLPIYDLLSPDAQLREMILRIDPSIRKFVFTASVSHHAQRCLEALGIADLIEGIIDVKDCQFETKHSVTSFHIAMEKAGIDDPEACVFLDDSVKNIMAAREVGWRSVLVGRVGRDCGKTVTTEHAEHEVDRIHQLPEVFPELFLE